MLNRHVSLSGLVVACLWTLAASQAHAGYTVKDLGVIPGGSISSGTGIDRGGEVVGSGDVSGGQFHAFSSSGTTGTLNDLGTLSGGKNSYATSISASGLIAGYGDTATGQIAAWTSSGGGLQPLGTLPGWSSSYATSINNQGDVAGYAYVGNVTHAFTSMPGGGVTDLGTFGGLSSQANGINNSGEVVGSYVTLSGQTHAFVNGGPAGGFQDLGGLDGGAGMTVATAINASGVAVGYGAAVGAYHAFRTTPTGSLQDLGSLNGLENSYAYAINSLGQIVGAATSSTGTSRAFYYSDLTGMVDLNSLLVGDPGWILTSATGINDYGQITGVGTFNGQTHAFLLTSTLSAVPEASSLILTGLGLGALLAYRKLAAIPSRS